MSAQQQLESSGQRVDGIEYRRPTGNFNNVLTTFGLSKPEDFTFTDQAKGSKYDFNETMRKISNLVIAEGNVSRQRNPDALQLDVITRRWLSYFFDTTHASDLYTQIKVNESASAARNAEPTKSHLTEVHPFTAEPFVRLVEPVLITNSAHTFDPKVLDLLKDPAMHQYLDKNIVSTYLAQQEVTEQRNQDIISISEPKIAAAIRRLVAGGYNFSNP